MIAGPFFFFGLLGVFGVLPLILGIWTAVDAGSQPDWAFTRANTSKTLWVVLPLVTLFVCSLVTIVVGVMWFSSTKARVLAAAAAGPGPGPGPYPGGPPAGMPYGAPPVLPVPVASPARWAPDPRGRHELRYWDGQRWTDDVADAGQTSTDPLG